MCLVYLRLSTRASDAGCRLDREGTAGQAVQIRAVGFRRPLHHWDGITLFDKFQISLVSVRFVHNVLSLVQFVS